jgi:hypothetical protein
MEQAGKSNSFVDKRNKVKRIQKIASERHLKKKNIYNIDDDEFVFGTTTLGASTVNYDNDDDMPEQGGTLSYLFSGILTLFNR